MSAAISALTNNNNKNQNLALEVGLLPPLVDLLDLLKSRNMTVQLKVAMALESLAINNRRTQEAIVKLGADIYMIKLCEVTRSESLALFFSYYCLKLLFEWFILYMVFFK